MRYRELTRQLTDLGCRELPSRHRGSHRRWVNDATGGRASIPDWGSKDLRLGTIRSALRQLGIDWRVVLRDRND
ncbi:MAG: type II toxin-antitoxin system HicA family toxin [Chloroflexi bacterium]|nr:type II toxin-antitoxin system HicA family toxin [Chloroflexota bacterium]